MAIYTKIRHHTEYAYDREVILSPHLIRMRPAPQCPMPIHDYRLIVRPEHLINWQQDPFGNFVARLVFQKKTRVLSIDVEIIAAIIDVNPFDFFIEETTASWPFHYDPELAADLTPYLRIAENGSRLLSWIDAHKNWRTSTIDFLVTLNRQLHAETEYLVRMEPGLQTCEETLQLRSGSCRDSAWLLLQILRHLGVATRYVSGYLVQREEDSETAGPEDKYCVDLHAWVEAYLPGAGWIGLDPSAGLFAGKGYIPLACTPGPAAAAPVTGTHSPGHTTFSFSSSVEQINIPATH